MSKNPQLPKMRSDKVVIYLQKLMVYVSINVDLKKAIMIEIGSFTGESTVLFAEKFKKVIAIDPFIPYVNKKQKSSLRKYRQDRWDWIYSEFIKRIYPFKNIKLIQKLSDDAVSDIRNLVDFVYIDGEHTYKQCKKDIENYLPLIKKEGYIGGHDYGTFPGVTQSVNEVLGIPDALFGNDGNWVKKKSNIK